MDSFNYHELSLKELPTKELKQQRHKISRDSPSFPTIHLRSKSISPLGESDLEKCSSDDRSFSSPDSFNFENSSLFTTSCRTQHQGHSLPSSPLTNDLNNEAFESFHFGRSISLIENEQHDEPLDMTKKHSQQTAPKLSFSQQSRPSVITCASALLRAQCNLSDGAHQICAAKAISKNSSVINKTTDTPLKEKVDFTTNSQTSHCEISTVAGSSDPVIDEHFRRSLGKDYQHIFSKSVTNNISITVDDHFAKALGDTWHQIQQPKSDVTDSVPSTHSTTALKSQCPQFLNHSPKLIS